MNKTGLLLLFTTFYVRSAGHSENPIKSFSTDEDIKKSAQSLVYTLSTRSGSYFYASCNHETCEVTEVIPVVNGASYKKTCLVKFETQAGTDEDAEITLRSWGNHRALLVDVHKKTLKIQQVSMNTCNYTGFVVNNIKSAQVYVTDDNMFDVFWTSQANSTYIRRSTYTANQMIRQGQPHARGPMHNVDGLSNTWEVLLLGRISYQRETRKAFKSDKLVQVITQVFPGDYDVADLMTAEGHDESFLTSNSHDEFGVCFILKNWRIICERYGSQDVPPKLSVSLDYADLFRGREVPYNLGLYNLKDGNLIIVMTHYQLENNVTVIRGFTAAIIRPGGWYDHPLRVEFEKSDFTCSSELDPTRKMLYLPPAANVVERDDELCFQFICADNCNRSGHENCLNTTLKYRMKCVSEELFRSKAVDNGNPGTFKASLFLIFLTAFVIIE